MPTVREILAGKGPTVHCIDAGATILEATRRMNEHRIGAMVVTRDDQVVGIFTERDVLTRVVAMERSPSQTHVGQAMTAEVICVSPETDLDEAAGIMRDRRIRHLPVVSENGELVGMISIGDVNAFHASEVQATVHFLRDYIYGRV